MQVSATSLLHLHAGWFEACLPVHMLAMLMSTRAMRPQPWQFYDFGLKILWHCRYKDDEFFELFGVTASQIMYVLGLVGQAFGPNKRLPVLQQLEFAYSSSRHGLIGSGGGGSLADPWDRPLIVDVGMGLGADARYYLQQGFRVLAVEANPLAINAAIAEPYTKHCLTSGQLSVLNAAIVGPDANETHAEIFVMHARPEQSKSLENDADAVDAASLALHAAQNGLDKAHVRTVRCADLLRIHGPALYMKIDVETNTIDCLRSLHQESEQRRSAGEPWKPPKFISLEVEASPLVGPFYKLLSGLGYQQYKVCRQFVYSPGPCEHGGYGSEVLGCGSGPFGDTAIDYRAGSKWRPLSELPRDDGFVTEFDSGFDWFDLHAKMPD